VIGTCSDHWRNYKLIPKERWGEYKRMTGERALKWVQGFELDSTGTAQGLVTGSCKPDNESSEFHKRTGNLSNRCAAIDF